MSLENLKHLRPFLSIIIIVLTLFAIVFMQMEERRVGYETLLLSREYKKMNAEKRSLEVTLARITRPQLLDHIAQSKFALKKAQSNQIIHMVQPQVEKGNIN